jgi:hypothetical protein
MLKLEIDIILIIIFSLLSKSIIAVIAEKVCRDAFDQSLDRFLLIVYIYENCWLIAG